LHSGHFFQPPERTHVGRKYASDPTTGRSMPTALILDGDGTIRSIDVHPNDTTRSDSAEFLVALEVL